MKLFSILILLVTAAADSAAAPFPSTTPAPSPSPVAAGERFAGVAQMAAEWGIEILDLKLTSAGTMLDFRYRVLDPTLAEPIFSRQVKPYLVDESTGARLLVPSPPKAGPLRTTGTPELGRTYFVLFGNPGRLVKAGQCVTVVIGEFRAAHLEVR
ncbi:MAG: hypothetical protein AB1625_01885 [Acidobacteriota bacterium]